MFKNTKIAFKLKSNRDLKKIYLTFSIINNKYVSSIIIFLVRLVLKLRININYIIKKTIFYQFCGGKNLEESSILIDKIGKNQVYSVLDYGVEGRGDIKSFLDTEKENIRDDNFCKG